MNNYYSDFPAMMSDGRVLSNWQPTAVLNDQIRTRENLRTNTEYRQYLQKNATSIMDFDKSIACQQTGCSHAYVPSKPPHQKDLLADPPFVNKRVNRTFPINQLPLVL
jgi:hypothetical protein